MFHIGSRQISEWPEKRNYEFEDSGTTFYKGDMGTFLCKINTPTNFMDGKCKTEVGQSFKRNNYFGDSGMRFYKEKWGTFI